jgi:arylformamidase
MLWRHYPDKASLDAQFSLDRIRDLPAVMARRLELSARARVACPHVAGLRYGERPEATLDLFLPPAEARPAPVLVFIHGGFWRSLDAATFAFVGGAFAPRGALVAVLDYPLIPQVRMADIVAHVRMALGWLSRNAAAHGGDPRRLHVGGHSAGGQLAVLAAETDWQRDAGIAAGAVRGILSISGVFDLAPVRLSFQQDQLGFTAEECAQFSPVNRVPSGAPPLIVAVGGAETQEFVDQSLDYAARWRAAGNAADMHVVAMANHIDILADGLAARGQPLHEAVCAQMGLG